MFTKTLFRLYVACLTGVLAAHAADYYVAVGGMGDYTQGNPGSNVVYATKTLAVNPGDVVHLATGTYDLTGNYYDQYRHVNLKGGVTLIGGSDNPEETRLVGDGTTRVIYIDVAAGQSSGVVIRNLTVANGYTAYQAAGICGNKIDYVVSNCVVEGCSAKYRGGGACCGTWYDSVIRNCSTLNAQDERANQDGSGGGIYGGTLYNCVITNNSAAYLGGGVAGGSQDARFYLKTYNCTIGRNTAPYGGGAGAYTGFHTTCQLIDCTIVSNTATSVSGLTWGGRGGGAWSVFATNCDFTGNVAQYPNASGSDPRGGGGLAESRAFDCDIVGNRTTQKAGGGGNVSGGGVDGGYCENCRILNNSSWSYGGGCIYNTNVNCVVAGNSGTIGGGALHCVFRDCIISNNEARSNEGGAAYGGATYNCTVMFNKAKTGAALFKGFHQGDIVASNVVTSATTRGSGISSSTTTPDATALNCTVVGNTGGECQIYFMYVTNMIVVGTATDVKNCTTVNSLIGTRSGGTVEACLEGVDPKFVTAPKEGESAYSLLRSSPCRDKGLYLPWMTGAKDLLGNPRVKFGAVDFGALECMEAGGTMIAVR